MQDPEMTRSPNADGLSSWKHPAVREVFRDDVLWVLDKPAGVLSHPNPPAREAPNALLRGAYDLKDECYSFDAPGAPARRVYLVHRLDQETSGLILCAFEEEAASRLKEALFHREVKKEYRAVLVGVPSPRRGEWADLLEKSRGDGRVTAVRRPGEPNALAGYGVLKVFEPAGLSLVALWPETGRTHQLRVQAASRGHPIAGDDRYGDFTANKFLDAECGLKRMFLHSYHIEIRHPRTSHLLRFQAPFTARLAEPLARMKALLVPVPRRAPSGPSRGRRQKGFGRFGKRSR
jgi:RluA family pseudouridine synthase